MNKRAFFTVLALAAVLCAALLAWQFRTVILLAFAGLLLSILLRHLSLILHRHSPLPVGVAMALVVVAIVAAFGVFFTLAGPRIASELVKVAETLPSALGSLQSYVKQTAWGPYLLQAMPDGGGGSSFNIVGMMGGTVSMTLGLAADLVVVISVTAFLAINPGIYRRGFLHLVPTDRRDRARDVLDALSGGLWQWLLGQMLDMVAVALMTGFGLWLIGVPLPMALGLIAGLTNFIPYLGPFLSGIPATLIAFSQSPVDALYTAGLFLVVQQIEGNILMPLIQKRATSLPPVLTILAVVGMGGLFGILGALLATPLLLVTTVVVRKLYVEDVLGDPMDDAD